MKSKCPLLYPAVGLLEARAARDHAKRSLAANVDPSEDVSVSGLLRSPMAIPSKRSRANGTTIGRTLVPAIMLTSSSGGWRGRLPSDWSSSDCRRQICNRLHRFRDRKDRTGDHRLCRRLLSMVQQLEARGPRRNSIVRWSELGKPVTTGVTKWPDR